MRTTRTVRRLLTTAITAGALFALPAAANAAVTVDIDLASPASPAEAGATVNYTLNISPSAGDSDDAATIALSIYRGGGNGAIIGTPVVNAGGPNTDNVTAGGAGIVNIDADFASADGDVSVTVPVTLPRGYRDAAWENAFQIRAIGSEDGFDGLTATSTELNVAKGGPSQIAVVPTKLAPAGADGLVNRWVKKDTDAVAEVLVANRGTGTAHFVVVDLGIGGEANELFSPTMPAPATAFTPELTITGGCTVDPTDATVCEIAELAPGATVTVTASVKKVTHFGQLTLSARMDSKADSGDDRTSDGCGGDYVYAGEGLPCALLVDRDGFYGDVAVTDGTTAEPHLAFGTDKVLAANGEEVVFNGEITNNGPAEIKNGKLSFSAVSFKTNGSAFGAAYTDTPDVVKTIQVIDIPGVTCTNRANNALVPAKSYLDRYDCTVPSLPAGARLAFVVKAKFSTAIRNFDGAVSGSFSMTSYAAPGSDINPSTGWVTLNADKTQDIEVTAKSQALIGAGHIAPVTVTVKNNGNTKARTTNVSGSIENLVGEFDNASHGASCTNVVKKRFVNCSFGELAPGQSKSIDLWVVAGKKLGSLPVSISAYGDGAGVESNVDNNNVVQTLTVVKANMAPLLGVKANKFKAAKLAAVLKAGIKTQVTAPGAATIKVDLAVTPKVAKQLGLAKKVGKKNVVIGTKTVKTTKSGKVMVATKLSLKYKKKIAAAKAKFAVMRVVTVTSNEKKTAGATSLTTSTTTFTVAKKKAKK